METDRLPEDAPPREREKAAANRRVQRALERMHERRLEFLQALQTGQPSTDLSLRFQSSIVGASEELRPWRHRAGGEWEEAGPEGTRSFLDELPVRTAADTVETKESVGFGREKTVEKTRPQLLPEPLLLRLSHDIDDIAREIGFQPGPERDPDPVDGGRI